MKYYFLIVFAFLNLFFLTACQFSGDGKITVLPLDESNDLEQNLYSDWAVVNFNKSVHFKIFEIRNKDNVLKERISILSFNKNKNTFEIKENVMTPLSVGAWHSENPQALAVINGSFFDENYKSTGGLWLNGQGKIISLTGNNSYDGAVIIDENGKLSLRYLPQNNLQSLKNEEQVLVNFPMLIYKGKQLLKENSDKKALRSLIAEDEQFIYFIKSDLGYFSLYEIMLWVYSNLDGIENLLNLDGGSSSGLSVKGDLIQWQNNSFVSVPNVIFAYEKK